MKLWDSFAKAQAAFAPIVFDSEARMRPGAEPYRYASLQAILKATIPALNAHGLSVTQAPTYVGGRLGVTTTLRSADESWDSYIEIPLENPTFHVMASAITYLKRYALASILCVAADQDEDGHAASRVEPREEPKPPPPPPARTPASPPREAPPDGASTGHSTIEALVSDVEVRKLQNGVVKYGLKVGDAWMSTFNDGVGQWLVERKGRRVMLKVQPNGRYTNILDAWELTPSGAEVHSDIPF